MADEGCFIYLGHLDRLRLARELVVLLNDRLTYGGGEPMNYSEVLVVAERFSTPWENPERMARELLAGEPDPFEEFP